MLSNLRKLIAAVTLVAILSVAVPSGAAAQAAGPTEPDLGIQVKEEDKVDLDDDGKVSLAEAKLMASYRLALKARQNYLEAMAAKGEEVSKDTLDLISPNDPRTVAPEAVDSDTIRNVLINLWTRWEMSWF